METRNRLIALAIILLTLEAILIPVGIKIRNEVKFRQLYAEWHEEFERTHPEGICYEDGCEKKSIRSGLYCYTHTCNINGCDSRVVSYGRCSFHAPTSDFQRVLDEKIQCVRPGCYSRRQQNSNYCYDHRDMSVFDP